MTIKSDSHKSGVSFKHFCEDMWYLAVAFRDEKDATKVTIRPIIAGQIIDSIQIPSEKIDKIRRVSSMESSRIELVEIQVAGKLSIDLTTLLMALPPTETEQSLCCDGESIATPKRRDCREFVVCVRNECWRCIRCPEGGMCIRISSDRFQVSGNFAKNIA